MTLQVEPTGNPNMKFNSLPHMLPKLQEMLITDGQMNNIYQKATHLPTLIKLDGNKQKLCPINSDTQHYAKSDE